MGMENYMLDSQLIEGYDLMTAGDPFFSFIITFSGHGPYTDHMRDISDAHLEQDGHPEDTVLIFLRIIMGNI